MNNYDQVRHQSKSRILLELIRQYEKPQEESRMIEDAKQRSVLQIEKRFTRSDVNRIYVFPRIVQPEANILIYKQRNLDIIGYNTQRVNLSSTRPMSTSKVNSAERIRNISGFKHEHILIQLKKAQDQLKRNQQSNFTKRQNQKSTKETNSSLCQELLKKIYTQNYKIKVAPPTNLKTTDLYKNIENLCKTSKPLNKSTSGLIPQYLKKQISSIFAQDNFHKIQNVEFIIKFQESMGYSPQQKYQPSFTSRQINKTMLNISKQQTINSCKSFELKPNNKLSQSPQPIIEQTYHKNSQTRHLTQFLKNITQNK